MHILIIDDDKALCRSLQIHLEALGHTVAAAFDAATGLAAFSDHGAELAFIDLQLPDKSGLDVLRQIRNTNESCFAVMITGTQDMKATIEAVRLGAFDYIRKPLDLDAVVVTVEKALQQVASATKSRVSRITSASDARHEIIGAHPTIIEVIKQIALLSASRIPVLIVGESGTGKELVARALHNANTPGKPFVAINCSAVVPTLIESELFGHVRGAFTGADSDKKGRLELAEDGVVFFDEIGDLSLDLQGKLLRALQEREFERVGSAKSIALRARVIAATLHDVAGMVEQGAFREDLYYRIAVSTIRVPALRERRSDIPMLAEHLLAAINADLDKQLTHIEDKVLRRLQSYDWPGNVRELENVLTRASLFSRGNVLTEESVAEAMSRGIAIKQPQSAIRTLRDMEKDHVESALYATGWNITQTAAALDISPTTLRKKIHDYSLSPPPSA